MGPIFQRELRGFYIFVVFLPFSVHLHGMDKSQCYHQCSYGAQGPHAIPQQVIHELEVHLGTDQHCKARVRGWGLPMVPLG